MTRVRIGDSLRRSEDTRFLTGDGRYIDDVPFDDLAHALVLRSPHAHARIGSTNVDEAARLPGVRAILFRTGKFKIAGEAAD